MNFFPHFIVDRRPDIYFVHCVQKKYIVSFVFVFFWGGDKIKCFQFFINLLVYFNKSNFPFTIKLSKVIFSKFVKSLSIEISSVVDIFFMEIVSKLFCVDIDSSLKKKYLIFPAFLFKKMQKSSWVEICFFMPPPNWKKIPQKRENFFHFSKFLLPSLVTFWWQK